MKYRIAIVDDDEDDRYLTKRALKDFNPEIQVVEFEAGDYFLDCVRDETAYKGRFGEVPPPVMVLMDINMPRMSGLEVLENLEKLGSAVVADKCLIILMFTSSEHAKDKADAFQHEFVKDYIVKPLEDNKLRELLQSYEGWSS